MTSSSTQIPADPVIESWSHTYLKVTKFTHVWTIDKFPLYFADMGETLNSPLFSLGDNSEMKWRLQLDYKRAGVGFIAAYLQLVSGCESSVRMWCMISILNSNGEKKCQSVFKKTHVLHNGSSLGFKNFAKISYLCREGNHCMIDNKLIVNCDINIIHDPFSTSGLSKAIRSKSPPCNTLPEDLGNLLKSESFSDVILSVDGTEFRVHKAVLSSRSPVFAAMFEHDMEEQKTSRVEITDMDVDVFQEMLSFIYTGNPPNPSMVSSLLVAADRYLVVGLKQWCEEYLCSNLSVESVSDILCLADIHSAEQLRGSAIEFMKRHATLVVGTDGWRSVVKRFGKCFVDIFWACTAEAPSTEPPRKRFKLF